MATQYTPSAVRTAVLLINTEIGIDDKPVSPEQTNVDRVTELTGVAVNDLQATGKATGKVTVTSVEPDDVAIPH